MSSRRGPRPRDTGRPPGPRLRAIATVLLPWVAMSAAFVQAISVSWRRWGDLIVDTGRELELPRRLAAGELLYRDARFYYGPLAPYLNAALYKIFGVHADVLMWAGIVSAGLLCVALYGLGTSFLPRWAAATVVVASIYLCLFAHLYVGAIFNFALPYTFSATYGIVAATWSLVLLVRHVRARRRATFLLSLVCLGLAALSKLEPFGAAVGAHAVFLGAMLLERPRRWRFYLGGYGLAAAAVAVIYGCFRVAAGPDLWQNNLAGVVNRGSKKFILGVMGIGDVPASLAAMGASAALLAAVLILGWLVARRLAKPSTSAPLGWLSVAAFGVATFLAYRRWELHVHFRALPVVIVLAIAILSVAYARQEAGRDERLAQLLLWVFSLGCLLRILLNSRPHHYGFYLLPVGLMCMGVLLFDYGPRVSGAGPWPRRVFGAAGIGLFAASITIAYVDSRQFDALQSHELVTPRGHLRVLDRWGLQIAAVRALSSLPPGTRAMAVPEGSGLLFFSGVGEGDTMFSYLPMEIVGPAGDAELLSRWRGNPPDVAVWVGVPLEEFDSEGFGKDYANRSMAWFLSEYAPVTDPTDAIVLLARRDRLRRNPELAKLTLSRDEVDQGRTVTGKILESFDFADGTFLRLDTGSEKLWAGVRKARVTNGSKVTVFDAMPGGMEARGLLRRFEQLLVGRLDPPVIPVAGLRAESESFADEDVAIRGKVVEVLPSNGRVRRVRVRDAAGLGPGNDEIVVLTLEGLKVGDDVHARGRLGVNRDYGAGDADALVLEAWNVSR